MHFEAVNALCDLDRVTPQYIREEMYAHSDTKTLLVARAILSNGIAGTEITRTLRHLLRVDSV